MAAVDRPGSDRRVTSVVAENGEVVRFIRGSGNVFADLGLENPAELLVKSDLLSAIEARMKELRLTRRVAARRMGVDVSVLARLDTGDLDAASVYQLMTMLAQLRPDRDIAFHPTAAGHGGLSLRMVSG